MDVVRQSFATALPQTLAAIARASFVAIDLEFTGIARAYRGKPEHADVPFHTEYGRAHMAASLYGVTQVGLSCFELRPSADPFNIKPSDFQSTTFNYNVFPGVVFRSEPRALEFLRANGFDFNKFVGEGIRYAHKHHRRRRKYAMVTYQDVDEEEAQQNVDDAAGFCHVMEALFDAEVPVVGHNMLFDLAFIHSHFHKPLPDEVKTFVQQVSKVLPHVWDTKYLAAQLEGGTSLSTLFMQCGFDVQALHSDNCVRYSGVAPSAGSDVHELDRGEADSGDVRETMHTPTPAAFAHEAGADAFMTGCVLLELASRAPQKQWVEHLQLDHPDANQVYIRGDTALPLRQ